MNKLFERVDPDICSYCKQDKSNHAATCLFGSAGGERLSSATPAEDLARKWKNEPDKSAWLDYKRDDLGNPVLSPVLGRVDFSQLFDTTMVADTTISSGLEE